MCAISSSFVSYFLIVLMSGFLAESYESTDEGSACQLLGYAGICQRIESCPVALEALKAKGRHELKVCGYDGIEQIVCCPDLSDRNPVIEIVKTTENIWSIETSSVENKERAQTKRKSEKACEKNYADYKIAPLISKQIFNGLNAEEGQFPHMAALGFENSSGIIDWRCGGSLISRRYVLTAAHCFVCNSCSDPKKVRLGVININKNELAQDIDVKNSTPHPNFHTVTRHNDIGLIELAKDVETSQLIYPACLYSKAGDPESLEIVGWGLTDPGDSKSRSEVLKFARIHPINITQCNSTYMARNENSLKTIERSQICATTKSDACPGDSGGPLHILVPKGAYQVVGVISYGPVCGSVQPGIYTRVSEYLDWIEDIVWPD